MCVNFELLPCSGDIHIFVGFDSLAQEDGYDPQRIQKMIMPNLKIDPTTFRLGQHRQLSVVQFALSTPKGLCLKHNFNGGAEAALVNNPSETNRDLYFELRPGFGDFHFVVLSFMLWHKGTLLKQKEPMYFRYQSGVSYQVKCSSFKWIIKSIAIIPITIVIQLKLIYIAIVITVWYISSDAQMYHIGTHYMNWAAASRTCEELGGYLIDIGSEREQHFIQTILDNTFDGRYIGYKYPHWLLRCKPKTNLKTDGPINRQVQKTCFKFRTL